MALHQLTRRQLLRAAGLAAGVAAVSSCAAPPGPVGAHAAQPRPDRLRMLYATAEGNLDAVRTQLPAFRDRFGFGLEIDGQPYDALQQRTFAELAVRSGHYDIMIMDTPWTPALTRVIEPLSGYLRQPALNDFADVDLGDFIPKIFYDTAVYREDTPTAHFPATGAPAATDAISAAGFDIYGLPIQANGLTMAYRKSLFEDPAEQSAFAARTGEPLTVPSTWDEFRTVAAFFTRPAERRYGTTWMAGVGDWATDDFKTLLAGFGGDGHLIGDDLSLRFADEPGERALAFYRDMITDRPVVPPGTASASWDETASTFGAGLAAMSMNYHSMELDSPGLGEVGYAPVPRGQATGPHFGTYMLSINRSSAHKAWAYRAITWLTSAPVQLEMAKAGLHPTRTSVYDRLVADPANPDAEFYRALRDTLSVGVGRARLTNYTEVSQAIAVAVNTAATGRAEPRAALDQAARSVRRLLAAAGYEVPR
ncbi:extracellular solute-binding protein [Saccharopolyspora hirsuta]|uniref:Extracellular solute-binding protein n=1 Tax=Saccharopolyspora hirsuta TaxID=1837 RepID=A0A5M7CBX3_SACHI|nr:extracellular solute-binding protein [Saccharopolyspora hirsuta]KAA5837927.1 extracellular solute-binding protein [Saccharopolyspora hirsuta]